MQTLIQALAEVFTEACVANWDEEGAVAVSSATYFQAERFVMSLPSGLSQPDVSAVPNGEIAFEWRFKPQGIIVVSVAASRRLTFTSVFGEERIRGVVYFDGTIPAPLLAVLSREGIEKEK